VNTGTARIVIIVALLVTGGLLLANGFADADVVAGGATGDTSSPTPTETASPTGTQTQQPPAPTPDPAAPKDTVIAVFNGTSSPGLAGTVTEDLTGAGYKAGQVPADALQSIDKTVVYYVGGADADQNKSNATELAKNYFPDAKVKELDPEYAADGTVDKSVQVVVVVGLNNAPTAG
jgi:hypothetical protein